MTFVKGQSGNPAGRPPGALNKRTLMAEGLLDDDAEKITRKAIDLALAGDPTALRLCVDRILPRGKNRPVPIALPAIESAEDVRTAATTIMAGVCAGELTPTEGSDLMRVVESVARTLRAIAADARLAWVEGMLREVTARLDRMDGRREERNTSGKQAPSTNGDAARHPSPATAGANTTKQQARRLAAEQPAGAAPNTSEEQGQRRPDDKNTGEKQAQPMRQDLASGRIVDRQPARAANTSAEQAERTPANDPARLSPAPQPGLPKNTSAEQAEPPDPDRYLGPMPAGATPQQMAELVRTARSLGERIEAMEQAVRAAGAGWPPARRPWGSLAAPPAADQMRVAG